MRNTLKYVADKERKPFAADLKTIYQAPTEESALEALERVTEKWSEKYPNSMKSWKQNWDAISRECETFSVKLTTIRSFYDKINIIRRAFYYGKTKETGSQS